MHFNLAAATPANVHGDGTWQGLMTSSLGHFLVFLAIVGFIRWRQKKGWGLFVTIVVTFAAMLGYDHLIIPVLNQLSIPAALNHIPGFKQYLSWLF